jgi:hypothetical protein
MQEESIQTLNPTIICNSGKIIRTTRDTAAIQHAAPSPVNQSVSQSIDQRDWTKSTCNKPNKPIKKS